MTTTRRTEADVLCYNLQAISQGTVRRYYMEWRRTQDLPTRCDEQRCPYFTAPLTWNGQAFSLVLDHRNGNRRDNRTDNLRLLCPMCDSQLPTRGGKNKGRIQNTSELGYEVAHRDGRRDANVFPKGVGATASCGQLGVHISTNDENTSSGVSS
jgi:HNH endonuclease